MRSLTRLLVRPTGRQRVRGPQLLGNCRCLSIPSIDDPAAKSLEVTKDLDLETPPILETFPLEPLALTESLQQLAPLEQLAPLAGIGIDLAWYNPAHWALSGLVGMHDVTAMPIWLSIVATTMLLRIGLLPAMVYTMRNNAKLQGLQPQMDAIKVRTQAAQASGLSMETARAEETAQLQALFKRHDCNPFRGLLMPVVQAPFMISLFFALKSLEDPAVWPMAQLGGLAWFTDLTAPDELMVLPALSAAGFLATFEVASRGGSDMNFSSKKQLFLMKILFRFGAVAMIPLTYMLPSSVFIYFLTQGAFSVTQTIAMRNPAVREALALPLLPAKKDEPDGTEDLGTVNPFTKEGSVGVYNWVAGSLGTKKITYDDKGGMVYPKTEKEEAEISDQEKTAAALFNMAFVLRQQGKYEEALKLYERCFNMRTALLGPHDIKLAHTLHHMAATLEKMGEHQPSLYLTAQQTFYTCGDAYRRATLDGAKKELLPAPLLPGETQESDRRYVLAHEEAFERAKLLQPKIDEHRL